jgi:Domain of unknown function (DUF4405)
VTAIPVHAAPAPVIPRAKTIFYVRAFVALAMVAAWTVSAATGILVWQAADGRGAGQLPLLLGATKHDWIDVHVAISALAIGLTVTHLAIMRRGAAAYARLLLIGRRAVDSRAVRRPKAIVFVRAILVVAMLAVIPVVASSGVIPWLAGDGQRSGQQVLLFAITKRGWADIHTAISMAVVIVAVTHVVVVRSGLAADLRLLATGQRSAPRRATR